MKTLTLKIIAASASLLLLLSFPNQMRANESIQGIWQYAGKPAELLINLQSGLVTVHSHQLSPDSIGLTVMRNIVVTNKKTEAQMFNGYKGDFETVTLHFDGSSTIIVRNQNDDEVLRLIRP